MPRSCVDSWIIDYVCDLVQRHPFQAHDILFCRVGPLCLFDNIVRTSSADKIRPRVFSATRFNKNPSEVRAILEM